MDDGISTGSDGRHDITTTGVLIGTPAYMAPQALSGTFASGPTRLIVYGTPASSNGEQKASPVDTSGAGWDRRSRSA